jgi:hypothetical protein
VEEPPRVARALAEMYVQQLSGLKDYPPYAAGADRLANELVACAVSVEHAKAVVEYFDDVCPTPRELRDVAANLREKYAPPEPPERERWEREYGPPRPVPVPILADPGASAEADRTMWARIRHKLNVSDLAKVTWAQVYQAKRDLGYQLAEFERSWLDRGGGPPLAPRPDLPPMPARPITQADFKVLQGGKSDADETVG